MKKVLVFGGARSGVAVAKLLALKGESVVITDAKKITNKSDLIKLGIEVYDEGHPETLKSDDWLFVVKNPGINYKNPFIKYYVEKQIPIYNELEIALKYSNFKIGAITGTNGKTTTTTLLSELLKSQYASAYAVGNIGYPLSDLVASGVTEGYLALEISAFQLLDTPSLKPLCSTIINLTPDHLDFFDSLEDYYQAKLLVYKNQDKNDYYLYNADDVVITSYPLPSGCNLLSYSLYKPADIYINNGYVYIMDACLFKCSDLKIVGEHNLLNAMIASAMAYLMGVSANNIKKVINNFKGVEHRIEFVNKINGVSFYNDSKATNVDSTIVCLKAFKDKPTILLAGGYDKKTGFIELKPYLEDLKALIVFGDTKDQLKALDPKAIVVNNLEEALMHALNLAGEGDNIVLSPACASYDQFNNFEERGCYFKELVSSLNL